MTASGSVEQCPKRLIVAITGATGAIYGLRILEAMRSLPQWETHLVLSDAGAMTAWHELKMNRRSLESLATRAHRPADIAAPISSGSFLTEGMIVAPCSMRTLAAIAYSHADNLVARAADVVLKERRRLVLMPRETPLNLAHLRNMMAATEMGAIMCPPVPAFYALPQSIDELVAHTVGRVLDLFGIPTTDVRRWQGMKMESGN